MHQFGINLIAKQAKFRVVVSIIALCLYTLVTPRMYHGWYLCKIYHNPPQNYICHKEVIPEGSANKSVGGECFQRVSLRFLVSIHTLSLRLNDL